ncbi:hypothetical protein UC34_03350 [Pandoraea vervacti]|jgi:hypothetical protein|uniref:Uncharacterized protein n=2 Tax=Pandoraea TaxID=93217 RepID=A0A5E4ZUE0_9BURK|nr:MULTISPECIES: hypothetical protein [Pandoraea]AJP56298.1 hypothetical protein UC34_03350 [Pandoraea vervacti]VVE64934.1 hypothetical protein PCA31118_01846 [Pandoraea captiosa]
MKSTTIRMLRAYLLVASLGAMCIDACVVIAMLVFDVPQRIFTSGDFRIAMAGSLLLLVLAARSVAQAAYEAALASRHVTLGGESRQRTVAVREDCPHRLLVLFHLRIHRQQLAMVAL